LTDIPDDVLARLQSAVDVADRKSVELAALMNDPVFHRSMSMLSAIAADEEEADITATLVCLVIASMEAIEAQRALSYLVKDVA